MKRGRNHGYWNRRYWELVEREQRVSLLLARAREYDEFLKAEKASSASEQGLASAATNHHNENHHVNDCTGFNRANHNQARGGREPWRVAREPVNV